MIKRINSIEILNEKRESLRFIKFSDIFYIFAEVDKDDGKKRSSNALGKTILINLISYMFAGNNNSDLKNLKGFTCIMNISLLDENIDIQREIGTTTTLINGIEYKKLDTVKDVLNIDRSVLEQLIHFDTRKNPIYEGKNKYNSYQSAFRLLSLNSFGSLTKEFYSLSQEYDELRKRKNRLKSQISKTSEGIENLQIIKLKVDDINQELDKISDFQEEIILKQNTALYKEREEINLSIAKHRDSIEEINIRLNNVIGYLADFSETPTDVLKFIKQANKELGEALELELRDPMEFNNLFSTERIEVLHREKNILIKEKNDLKDEVNRLTSKLPKLKKIIDEKDELTKIFRMQNELYSRREKLLMDHRDIIEIGNIDKIQSEITKSKIEIQNQLMEEDIESLKEKYARYSRDLISKLYPNDFDHAFDIRITDLKGINTKKHPVIFDFSISKDGSEGVANVRNMIVDLMMLKFSDLVNFMVWDSSTLNGIDPNQVITLFSEMNNIAEETGKQIIIAINSFQLGDAYESFKNTISSTDYIVLSRSNNLLGIDISKRN